MNDVRFDQEKFAAAVIEFGRVASVSIDEGARNLAAAFNNLSVSQSNTDGTAD